MRSRQLRILTALSLAVAAHAQSSTTAGAIRGTVANKKGAAASGAHVMVRNIETGLTRNVSTSPSGEFSFPLLPVGNYEITINAPGLKSIKDTNVRVTLGQNTVLSFALDAAEAAATVEVVAAAESLDSRQVNNVSVVDEKLVQSIPLVTRNYTDLSKLNPGVTSGQSGRTIVEGGRQIFNNLQIDGAGNNSAFFGEQRGGAVIPFAFGADTIKELQVITNPFEAKYGNAAGAVINAITKSGTNEWTGSTLLSIRNDSWMARVKPVPYDPNGTTNTKTGLTRTGNSTNENFNVGGPIIKDRLFFFAGAESYETNRGITPNFAPTSTVAGSGNTLADFTAFAASNLFNVITTTDGHTLGQEGGNQALGIPGLRYNQKRTNDTYFGRLDFTLNDRHRLVGRVNFNKFEDNINNATNSGASNMILNKTSAISWVVESNDVWTDELFSDSRIQVAVERRPFRKNSADGVPELRLPGQGGFFGAGTRSSSPRESNEFTTQFVNNTTWAHGDFTVMGGVDFQKINVLNQFFQNNAGVFNFSTYAAAAAWSGGTLGAATPGTVTYSGATSYNGGRVSIDDNLNAAYLQGQYQGFLDKRLMLMAGLRYTSQSFSHNPLPNPNLKGLDSPNGSNAYDPRFAFSLDVFGDNKTVVRGGYGWFSTPTPMLLVANTMTGNGNTITNYSFTLRPSGATPTQQTNIYTDFNSGALSHNLISGQDMSKVSDSALAALVASGNYPAGSAAPTQIWDPENKMSRAKKTSLSVEQDMGNGLTFGVQATYVKYENLEYLLNINLNQIGGSIYRDGYVKDLNTFSTSGRPNTAVVRGRTLNFTGGSGNPAAGFGNVFLVKGDGIGDYKGLTFTMNKKWSEKAGLSANLTFSRANDMQSGERGTYTSSFNIGNFVSPFSEAGAAQVSNPSNPRSTVGISDNDRFMVLNLMAYFPVAYGVQASMRFNYSTGLPYSPYDARDLNGDGVANAMAYGSRNSLRQADERTMDLRLSRAFRVWRTLEIEGIVDVFNVFNWASQTVNTDQQFATTATGASQPAFGAVGGRDFSTREVQFGLKLKF
ncbi:MAG TPA: TonB-dependent receptor [Holophagaceae bacterium]|nr:TonB-dependent receptor [Holophagaceae bacterium]HJW34131.1 TonB-dependent receptor [Holophagaceae bacterium]